MESAEDLRGIDLVWWPTLLRSESQARQGDEYRFTTCLTNLVLALEQEEQA